MNNSRPTSDRIAKLPEEIIEAHKARSDYLKWKLILVAALGTAGLGLHDKLEEVYLFLALIPLVCIYVDLLCVTLKVRVIVIGTFFANECRDTYERFTQRNRQVFKTEDWAQHYSTYVVCMIVAGIGLFGRTFAAHADYPSSWHWPAWHGPDKMDLVLVLAGVLGFILSWRANSKSTAFIDSLSAVEAPRPLEVSPLETLRREHYAGGELSALAEFLKCQGVFQFKSLANGLYSAAGSAGPGDASGYQHVWVRDNVHVAHAHFVCGDQASAGRALSALMTYFHKHRSRLETIIALKKANETAAKGFVDVPMNRPHIRFEGPTLTELKQQWPHAQNDALGYFLWCYCKFMQEGLVEPGDEERACLILFPLYFEAIEYWQDRDSGHWEEARKVSASSIGAVVAGLRELQRMLEKDPDWARVAEDKFQLDSNRMQVLRAKGEEALRRILPREALEPEACYRRYDSALLFLIFPLEVVDGTMADTILEDVQTHLQGDHGIRRYLGDSYWFPDYKKVPESERTADFSENQAVRDAWVRVGQEAQWCIFDSIVSVIYGRRRTRCAKVGNADGAARFLELQTHYFNRAISQLTFGFRGVGDYKMPEAYYLENGRYVPNDHTPLLWAQANLWMAVKEMERSIAEKP